MLWDGQWPWGITEIQGICEKWKKRKRLHILWGEKQEKDIIAEVRQLLKEKKGLFLFKAQTSVTEKLRDWYREHSYTFT